MTVDDILTTDRGRFGVRVTRPAPERVLRAPVVCLHGFPDDASTFDEVAAVLSASGHPVLSVFLRGYDPSPLEGPYAIADLAHDLVSVARAVGGAEPVHLLAHDYGAQIAFTALAAGGDLFRSAVLLSGAHPDSIQRNARRHPRQLWCSRYIVFFQLSRWADRRMSRNDFAAIDRLWRRWSPRPPSPAHRERVKATLRRSMPAPIAMYRGGGFELPPTTITVPTLFIAGADDRCILPEMSDGQERLFAAPYRREVWGDVGHFPHHDDPARTAGVAVEWFEAYGASD